jgi:hypothetical protein
MPLLTVPVFPVSGPNTFRSFLFSNVLSLCSNFNCSGSQNVGGDPQQGRKQLADGCIFLQKLATDPLEHLSIAQIANRFSICFLSFSRGTRRPQTDNITAVFTDM